MSAKELVLNQKFIFDGTNYDVWKSHILDYFRGLHPNIEQILDMGFSSPMDPQNLSLEEKTNSYLDAHVSKVLCLVVIYVVMCSIMPCRNAHEIWTKLQENMMCPISLRTIVLLPLPAVMSSHLHPLHQSVERHKVMIW